MPRVTNSAKGIVRMPNPSPETSLTTGVPRAIHTSSPRSSSETTLAGRTQPSLPTPHVAVHDDLPGHEPDAQRRSLGRSQPSVTGGGTLQPAGGRKSVQVPSNGHAPASIAGTTRRPCSHTASASPTQ